MIKHKLIKPILIYLAAWLAVVATFWCGLGNDAMLFSFIMTIASIVVTMIVTIKFAKLKKGKMKEWLFIFAIAITNTAFSYLTFSLSNNISFNKINAPDWDMLTMSLTFAFVGIMIGRTFPMKAKTREGKIETVIRLVAKILAVAFIITVASSYILPAETAGSLGVFRIAGDYQAVEQDTGNDDDYVGSFWHLYIGEDDESGEPYLAIYDNEAGNPGIEGRVAEIGNNYLIVEYDPDYYDQLPSSRWGVDGKYLNLEYKLNKKGIELTNNGTTIQFNRDDDDEE